MATDEREGHSEAWRRGGRRLVRRGAGEGAEGGVAAREANEAGTGAGAAETERGDGAPGAATLTSGRESGERKVRLADETTRTTGAVLDGRGRCDTTRH